MILKAIVGLAVAAGLTVAASSAGFAASHLFPHSGSSSTVVALHESNVSVTRFDLDVHAYVVDDVAQIMEQKTSTQWRIYDVIQYRDHLFVDVQTIDGDWWLLVYRWEGTVWEWRDTVLQNISESD
jgi:hypothetical protein